jgi:hypothetical protein
VLGEVAKNESRREPVEVFWAEDGRSQESLALRDVISDSTEESANTESRWRRK